MGRTQQNCKNALLLFLAAASFLGCASSREPAESPNAASSAVYGVDHHYLDARPEVREYVPMEFYFKKCSVENVGQRAGVGRSYECTDP